MRGTHTSPRRGVPRVTVSHFDTVAGPAGASGWRPRSGDAARTQVRSPRGRLISADAEQWMSRPAGDLRGSAPSRAASFSCDSNRRLFRYMRISTKDCNSSSFVWEGTTAAGSSWALPGGRRLRRGGGGAGRAGAACGWGGRRPAGLPRAPPRGTACVSSTMLLC